MVLPVSYYWSKPGRWGQASVLTFRIQGSACGCNLELDHFKEMLRLGSPAICKLLPECGFIMYSARLKVPYLMNCKSHAMVMVISALPNISMFGTGVGWLGWHCHSWLEKSNSSVKERNHPTQPTAGTGQGQWL